MTKKLLLFLAVAVVASATAATFANNQVAVLTSEEADAIVGAFWDCECTVLTSSCYKYSQNCSLSGDPCRSYCVAMGLQDSMCKWYLFGTGCTTLAPINCGSQWTGACDDFFTCVYTGWGLCGTVTNCS